MVITIKYLVEKPWMRINRKTIFKALLALEIVLLLAMCGYGWDSSKNRGYTWGYWGEFNSISNSLGKIPGIKLSKSGYNDDITVEHFEFDVVTAEGRPLALFFSSSDAVRKLSVPALSKALLERIHLPQ